MTTPTITCRDTDDDAYWADRLNAAERQDCEALLDAMLDLHMRLTRKGIPTPGVTGRLEEGKSIFAARFGDEWVPF